jgi:hypothetical protein
MGITYLQNCTYDCVNIASTLQRKMASILESLESGIQNRPIRFGVMIFVV